MQQEKETEGIRIEKEEIKLSFLVCVFFAISRTAPAACGGSQARGLIRAVATSLCQSHSNVGSELHLQPSPQLMAMPDP